MNDSDLAAFLKARVRTVRDWPQAGVNFRDVTTLFSDPEAIRVMIEAFSLKCKTRGVDAIAGVDARGFILGGALAYQMHKPFVPVRKKGKLPHDTVSQEYDLEYGKATVEIHTDACRPGDRIMVVDDLIATGGTLLAATKLFESIDGVIAGVAAVIDLPELGGSKLLREANYEVHALCSFTEEE
jgi:adenine phosphoribosyltransferase